MARNEKTSRRVAKLNVPGLSVPRPAGPEAGCATAWFAVLERARLTDDYELAAKAQRQLERLGVQVRFKRARQAGEVSCER